MVIAWLERDVRGRAARGGAGSGERFDLSVWTTAALMPADTDQRAVTHQDAANLWIGPDLRASACPGLDRRAHPRLVERQR